MKWTINSDAALQKFLGDVRELYFTHRYMVINAKVGGDRSQDQNSISHCWYEQAGRELREYTALGHKSYCKLHHGVPILRAEDESFRAFYDVAIKRLTYEEKIKAMEYVPVTSIMTFPQFQQYLLAVQADYRLRNVALEFPLA